MYKTLRLVRICLLIVTVTKSLRFFSEELFYKSHRKLFSCVCIAWYKHSRDWENSGQLCKPSTSSLVSITVSNSPNPSRVYIRLCKHEKRFLLLKYYLVSHSNNNLSFPFPYGQTLNCNELLVSEGGGGYSHTIPTRVCAAQRGRDFEVPDLERGIHFRGVF